VDPPDRPPLVEVRPPRLPDPLRALVALAAVTFVALAGVGILQRPAPAGPATRATPAPSAPAPSPSASPATASRAGPAWVHDLAGLLECSAAPQPIGGEIGEVEPIRGFAAPVPYPWLSSVDALDLPFAGWRKDPDVPWYGEDGFVRYVNETHWQVKAALVMAGDSTNARRGSWAVVAFRACRPAEFERLVGRTTDDAPWLDATGRVSDRVRGSRGDARCGWESTVWLRIDDRLYVRDPAGLLRNAVAGGYLASTELPRDAVPTGLSSWGRELFASPDFASVWIRTGAVVERWPRATSEPTCR
jgi:hypothetical protein